LLILPKRDVVPSGLYVLVSLENPSFRFDAHVNTNSWRPQARNQTRRVNFVQWTKANRRVRSKRIMRIAGEAGNNADGRFLEVPSILKWLDRLFVLL
jgi:hypothetical protein